MSLPDDRGRSPQMTGDGTRSVRNDLSEGDSK
jgi:hypothetical protein